MKRLKNTADVESVQGETQRSMSSERKRKARRRGQREERLRGRVNSRYKEDGVWMRCEYWRQAVR